MAEDNFENAERIFEALHAYEGLEFALFDQIDPALALDPNLDHKAQAIAVAMSRYRADIRAVADDMLARHKKTLDALR